jgi:hypothetical protein
MEKRVNIGNYAAFIALGLAVSALQPTLPGLATQTSIQPEAITIKPAVIAPNDGQLL